MGEPLRERLRTMDRRELVALLVVATLLVAAGGFWYVRSLPGRVHVELAAAEGAPVQPSPSPDQPSIVVHVAGWVRKPGVYRFEQGDRVIDAVRRAGGTRPGADLTVLNLAALLTDAQQILVFKRGVHPAVGSVTGADTGVDVLINLNTATLDQLETLPGIGPTLAQRIIDHREENGPFSTVDDLLDVSGIGEQRLADIRSKVTV